MGTPSQFGPVGDPAQIGAKRLGEIFGSASVSELVARLPLAMPGVFHCVAHGVQLFDTSKNQVRIVALLQDEDVPDARLNVDSRVVRETVEHSYPTGDSPVSIVLETGGIVYLDNLEQEHRFPKILDIWRQAGVLSLIYLPLRTEGNLIGAFFCGSPEPKGFRPEVVDLLTVLADHIALAVSNCLSREQASRSRKELAKERDRLSVLLELAKATASELSTIGLMRAIFRELHKYFDHQFGTVSKYSKESDSLVLLYADLPNDHPAGFPDEEIPLQESTSGEAFRTQRTVVYRTGSHRDGSSENKFRWSEEALARYGFRWICAIPLSTIRGRLGVLNIGGLDPDGPAADQVGFLEQLASHLALALERTSMLDELRDLNERLARENLALQEDFRVEHNFEEIVGRSEPLKSLLRQLEVVAGTDATVLILGESGSGKELIARAIHRLSRRSERSFIKINCAAIPSGLLESELFGHEKGAFTGAISQKPGRFELAADGTIFLDEVGEIPLELQSKLLRVLQEMEFERLGSHRTIKVNVRVIAATNRELKEMVNRGDFREDLYYRLNVFPLTVPPLRERREDIPLLVRFFVQESSRKLGRHVTRIPEAAMTAMQSYSWPGNVRELQNFVERAVILSRGSTLQPPVVELGPTSSRAPAHPQTLEEAERKIIIEALNACGWVIGGNRGAAARLGMKRTTLQSRMGKLGIRRP